MRNFVIVPLVRHCSEENPAELRAACDTLRLWLRKIRSGIASASGSRWTLRLQQGTSAWLSRCWRLRDRELTLGPVRAGHSSVLTFLAHKDWVEGLPEPVQVTLGPGSSPDHGQYELELHTASTVKGLEADSVVVYIPSAFFEARAATYVSVSRARLSALVVANANVATKLPELSR